MDGSRLLLTIYDQVRRCRHDIVVGSNIGYFYSLPFFSLKIRVFKIKFVIQISSFIKRKRQFTL